MPDLEFEYSPTQSAFITSNDHIAQLMGAMAEGKTFAGVGACIYHAQRCGRPIEGALVRDTFQNIKTSTIKDFREYLGALAVFSDGGKHLSIKCDPPVELDLFGIDDEASISKLQGGSRRGRLPEMRAGLARELVEGIGLTMAEAARRLGVTTSGISRILERNKLGSGLSRQSTTSRTLHLLFQKFRRSLPGFVWHLKCESVS